MILDKPGAPNGPLKVSDVHSDGCKLSWSPPDDDGGCPIENYVVEKMDEATGKLYIITDYYYNTLQWI